MASGRPVARSWALRSKRRGTDQLRDDDALRPIDNERALIGHLGEVAQENILLDRLGTSGPASKTETYSGLA
jgi:hypothetical protein